MEKQHIVTIEDLSNNQIEDILDLAEEMSQNRSTFRDRARGYILSTLFFEPSTRTRGSFESAMQRLGGTTISTAGTSTTSIEKGETLADSIRVWSGYSDLIVLRHPWEGTAQLAAEYSDVPVINAGDGSHEHPTQTLLDLFTLRTEFKHLEKIRIALCGDLKHGRTIHSLTYALLRFGAEIIFIPGQGLELPDHVKHRIETVYGRRIEKVEPGDLGALYGDLPGATDTAAPLDAVYMTPSKPHMPTVVDSVKLRIRKNDTFVFYVTRRQRERESAEESQGGHYPRVNKSVLQKASFSKAIVLHPLPRVDELSPEIDSDARAKYFIQAHNGVPVRMALIALLLELEPWRRSGAGTASSESWRSKSYQLSGLRCSNQVCVTQQEQRSVRPGFHVLFDSEPRFVCRYCERETTPAFYASKDSEVYRPVDQTLDKKSDISRLVFFMDESEALKKGLRRASAPTKTRRSIIEVARS